MSVNNVSLSNSMCICAATDYEAQAIARRLRELGIEPTADKQVNKTKLHEIELRIAKSRNEPLGGLLTVSDVKEQEIIRNKKENLHGSLKNYKKEKGDKNILKEDEVYGRQILAIIELKKREEKDKEKFNKFRLDKPSAKIKPKAKKIVKETAPINPQISPELKTEVKEKS